ncbi:hypothetical protein BHE74_00059109, partial [Ensete ventricosum]
ESNNHVVSEERYPSKDSQRASSAVCELSSIVPLMSFLFFFPTLTIAIICDRSCGSQERKRFGLLEKHKDYVLRARAFHQKEDTLTKIERLNSALHTLDHQPENKHVYYAEDRYA